MQQYKLDNLVSAINNTLADMGKENKLYLHLAYGKVFIYRDNGTMVRGGLTKREAYEVLYGISHMLYAITDKR